MTDKLIMNKQTNLEEIKVLIIQVLCLVMTPIFLLTVYSKCLEFVTPSPFKNGDVII